METKKKINVESGLNSNKFKFLKSLRNVLLSVKCTVAERMLKELKEIDMVKPP